MNLLRKFGTLVAKNPPDAPTGAPKEGWEKPFETLERKWVEVPTTRAGRIRTTDLLTLSDEDLLRAWTTSREDITTGPEFSHRGWYHTLYAESMRGKQVLDVDSGFAIDSITFAQYGAKMTFMDLAESNLLVVRRLCKILGLDNVSFLHLKDVDSLRSLPADYDVIMAMGSLHHAPVHVIKPEVQELIRHLKVGGRWLQLAYPKSRWTRDGRRPFETWGQITDGRGTPWAEWYDLQKLLALLAPAQFQVVLCQEFHKSDFIWFDLLYRG